MGFEGNGNDTFSGRSPGGFEFGVQGWAWGPPIAKSITFFLDGSAIVADQYGRPVRRAITPDGKTVNFADRPPEGNREGTVVPRPQFANHAMTLETLTAEGIDWQSYEVRWRSRDGNMRMQGRMTLDEVTRRQVKLLEEGNTAVMVERTVACAGWPQLPYEQLKRLKDLPPTPLEELAKIPDAAMRRDAMKMRREIAAAVEKDLASVTGE